MILDDKLDEHLQSQWKDANLSKIYLHLVIMHFNGIIDAGMFKTK